jgi:hypothetical protein
VTSLRSARSTCSFRYGRIFYLSHLVWVMKVTKRPRRVRDCVPAYRLYRQETHLHSPSPRLRDDKKTISCLHRHKDRQVNVETTTHTELLCVDVMSCSIRWWMYSHHDTSELTWASSIPSALISTWRTLEMFSTWKDVRKSSSLWLYAAYRYIDTCQNIDPHSKDFRC